MLGQGREGQGSVGQDRAGQGREGRGRKGQGREGKERDTGPRPQLAGSDILAYPTFHSLHILAGGGNNEILF